eukprot:Opistho-2@2838
MDTAENHEETIGEDATKIDEPVADDPAPTDYTSAELESTDAEMRADDARKRRRDSDDDDAQPGGDDGVGHVAKRVATDATNLDEAATPTTADVSGVHEHSDEADGATVAAEVGVGDGVSGVDSNDNNDIRVNDESDNNDNNDIRANDEEDATGIVSSSGVAGAPSDATAGDSASAENEAKTEAQLRKVDMKSFFGDDDDDDGETFGGFGDKDIEDAPGFQAPSSGSASASGGRKKIPKKAGAKTVPKAPRASSGGAADNNDGSVEDDDANVSKEVSAFDKILGQIKSRRSRGRKLVIDNTVREAVKDFVDKMNQAAVDDLEANKLKKPGVKKIMMLEEVLTEMRKTDLHETLIKEGKLLTAFANWLHPLPDKSLPPESIRTELLRVMNEMNDIERGDVADSGVGQVVAFLRKHPRETLNNRQLAKNLIFKWSRDVFQLADGFQRDDEAIPKMEVTQNVQNAEKARAELQSMTTGKKPGEAGFTYHARVPQPSRKEYVVRPVNSQANAKAGEDVHRKENKLDLRMGQIKAGQMRFSKTKQHAVQMSVSK